MHIYIYIYIYTHIIPYVRSCERETSCSAAFSFLATAGEMRLQQCTRIWRAANAICPKEGLPMLAAP